MPQSPLERKLEELAARDSGILIEALQALQDAVSDVRYPLGDKDSLELRIALRAVFQDSVDKLQRFSKNLSIRGQNPT